MLGTRVLSRYIFLEMLPSFFLSMSVLLLVLFLERLFKLATLIASKGASAASSFKVFLYVLPGFLVITIPMSLIVASLTTFSRLSADSEITAMKASRVSLYDMIRPVFLFALLAFGFTAFASLMLVPVANSALKEHLFGMVKQNVMVGIEPGVFSTTFDGMVIYVDRMDSLDRLEGVFISDERSEQEAYAIVAKGGRLIADQQTLNVTFALTNGSILTQPRVNQPYPLMEFDAARIYLDISSSLLKKKTPGKGQEDLDTPGLLAEIDRLRGEGLPSYQLETELHRRLSIPFACIILGLIGAPLGIRPGRSGKSAGIAIALLVFLVYFIVLSSATNLAETGTVSPALAFWIPNLVMTIAALLYVVKKNQEYNFMVWDSISGLYYELLSRMPWKRKGRLS